MIIRKLTLHHFLSYHGVQAIELPGAEQDRLVIVVGPNNTGKTSLIRALKFWFYGEKGVATRADLSTLPNNKAKAETEVGKTLEAWVEVTFEHETTQGRETVTLRRTIEAKRVSALQWEVRTISLKHIVPRANPDNSEPALQRWQRLLEGLMPMALFDAFYFKGEPLDGKLLEDVNTIRPALGLFLHEDQWREAESAAARIRDKMDTQLKKLVQANAELTKAIESRRELEERLESQQNALQGELNKKADLEAEENRETDKLSKLGDEEAAREARAQLDRARQSEQSANHRQSKANGDLGQAINMSLGLPFLQSAIAPVREILTEMERENILPADISEGFVDRVLARSNCICGREHDRGSRESWETYRKKTLAADINEGLSKLLNWVKPDGHLSVAKRASDSVDEIHRLLHERRSAVADANEARAKRQGAETILANLPHEEIARIGTALRRLREEIRTTGARVAHIQRTSEATASNLRQQQEKVAALSARGGVNQREFENVQRSRDRAHRLYTALTECRSRLGTYFHRVLQNDVSASYDSKATDGSRAIIDRRTLLPSIQVQGQRINHLGGGQSQFLALAYVVALARLRQNMHAEMERLGVRLGRISDLSFFMDSPLGNMEEHYKTAATLLAPGCAKQVVLLLWKEEWDFVRPLLEERATAIHAVEFHTRAEDYEKLSLEAPHYKFGSGSLQLIHPLPPEDDQPRSKLIQIK